MQQPTLPLTLPLLVRGRLFVRYEPSLRTANHLDDGRFIILNPETCPVA